MVTKSAWEVLDLEPEASVAEVRSRYAALIKQYRPDTHPEDFARIRDAYDLVLRVARGRQARGASEAPVPEHTPAPRATGAPAELDLASPELPGDEAVGDRREAPAEQVQVDRPHPAEPTGQDSPAILLDELRRLQEFTRTHGEVPALAALRELLATSRLASLDARQALEFSMLRWFLECEAPPLLLMFDAGRAFDWHRKEGGLTGWIGSFNAQRLTVLLGLSRDEVFARYRAGNRWLRQLFEPHARPCWLGLGPALQEARAWELRWRFSASQLDQPALMSRLNDRVSQRLSGRAVLSTDVGVAVLAALFLSNLLIGSFLGVTGGWRTLGLTVIMAPLVAALRLMVARTKKYIALPSGRTWPARIAAWVWAHPKIFGSVALSLAFGLFIFGTENDMPRLVNAVAFSIAAPVATVVIGGLLWLLWLLVFVLERLGFVPLRWREAVDRWDFRQLLQPASSPPATASADRPFGPPLTLWQRVRSIPVARRLEREELVRHERPPRADLPRLVRPVEVRPASTGRFRFQWWWIWLAITLVRGLASLHS